MRKRGEITMTWIIMAAIALVTLVIIIAIFTGQSDKFVKSLNEEAGITLTKLKQNYGPCHPSTGAEILFTKAFVANSDESSKQQVINEFESAIETCKRVSDPDECGFEKYTGTKLTEVSCKYE